MPSAAPASVADAGANPPAAPKSVPTGEPSALDEAVADVRLLVPSVVVSQVSGASEDHMKQLVANVSKHLETCGARPGDRIEIAMLTTEGDVATRLRTSNADDAVNSCVLQHVALDIDAVLPSSLSASERQSEVRSILTIRFGGD